ncbi:hypothetical protein ROA7450_02328 [Roseovarius albus]|uniref:Uncharacterized protein n=1 Tax=Roseovarius albus TaxID=1247867 RepID=A0A1X6ZCM1_9RHOB|nr:hypothetical protein [Roseovarius albus]SLN47105.1 hypothetical protein ROA7450_02328 [Roseovarius albus]
MESCAIIRHALSKQNLPEDEHFFFRREMEAARQIGTFAQRLPYTFYKQLSNYGHSIEKPANALAFLWLVGVSLFSLHFCWGWFALVGNIDNPTFNTAMGLSFSNMFPPFGFGRLYFTGEFMRELPPILQVFSAFQTVMSLPLLFFLGLGLRQRFRLK